MSTAPAKFILALRTRHMYASAIFLDREGTLWTGVHCSPGYVCFVQRYCIGLLLFKLLASLPGMSIRMYTTEFKAARLTNNHSVRLFPWQCFGRFGRSANCCASWTAQRGRISLQLPQELPAVDVGFTIGWIRAQQVSDCFRFGWLLALWAVYVIHDMSLQFFEHIAAEALDTVMMGTPPGGQIDRL